MAADERPAPPWLEYPGSEPTWDGWRQGYSQAWFEALAAILARTGPTNHAAYLADRPPPDEDWTWYVREAWR